MATYVRSSGGHVAERVRPVPGSDEEQRYERMAAVREGGWRRVPDPEPKAEAPLHREPCVDGSVCGGPHCPPEAPKPPAKNANKDTWVAYAVAQGAEEAAAEAATKDDLIAAYGKTGDE